MKLDIRAVAEGKPLHFQHTLDFSGLTFAGRTIYTAPIRVKGQVGKAADVLCLEAHWETELSLCCDRCAADFTRNASDTLTVTLTNEAPQEERDDIFACPDGICDLDTLLEPVFILLPPQKTLCREDCAGLCPHCGQNLNEASCECEGRTTDPRLEALQAYLDKSR